jgi:omega-6 fatty acid desaturase (delta-12 desaturase)
MQDFSAPWRQLVRPYAVPHTGQAFAQLLLTALPFFACTAATIYGIDHGFWGAYVLALPAAAFLVRLFMIQHDCGHRSFFKARWANDVVGSMLGVLTLTPYEAWRQRHAAHHATSGNLDRRGLGDVSTLTVAEYLALPLLRRLLYRLYRHPLVMFGVGPTWLFLLKHRIPTGHPIRHLRDWLSVLGTNLGIVAVFALLLWLAGERSLLAYAPIFLLSASAGVWLFYVQHQFEDTYWDNEGEWRYEIAAFKGCSFYDLPRPLQWLTCHIGLHHIHHLSSKIPSYRLRECLEQNALFQSVKRLSLRESLGGVRLALWDETKRKLVPFSHIRALPRRRTGAVPS